MKYFKLLKDLPDHKVGDIRSEDHWTSWFKDHNFSEQFDNPIWFEEVDYMLVTQQGTKKRIGDVVYLVHRNPDNTMSLYGNTGRLEIKNIIYNNMNSLFFNTEWLAKSHIVRNNAMVLRGIEIGTKVVCNRECKRGSFNKYEVHEVYAILYDYDYTHNIKLVLNHILQISIDLKDVWTFDELAKKEDISIGMQLDEGLLEAWFMENKNNNNGYLNSKFRTGVVEEIGVNKYHQIGFVVNNFCYNLIGFKAFKKKWDKDIKLKEKAESVNNKYNVWRKCPNGDEFLMFIELNNTGYGINHKGDWFTNKGQFWDLIVHTYPKATTIEVKTKLLEIVKKNYPLGTKFKNIDTDNISTVDDNIEIYFSINSSRVIIRINNKCVFADGNWANIVDKPIFKDNKGTFFYGSDFKKGDVLCIKSKDNTIIGRFVSSNGYSIKFSSLLSKDVITNLWSYIQYKNTSLSIEFTEPFDLIETSEISANWLSDCENAGKHVPIFIKGFNPFD